MIAKIPSEHEEQKAFVRWLRANKHFVFAVPNGGLRDAITAKRLKDEGALSGVPDLCVVLEWGLVLWVEMKRRKGGRVSPEQEAFHTRLRGFGHNIIVAFGAADAKEQFLEFMRELLKKDS